MNNNIDNTIISEIIKKIEELPFNTETTIAELINYNPEENYVAPLKQGEISYTLNEKCKKRNICIEANMDEKGGLAFYAKFRKTNLNESENVNMNNEFKVKNNIVFEDEGTKKEYEEYIDEINEYNRKVANGETPDTDLSEITSKFKEKFDIEGLESIPVEDKNFDELIEKINKSLDNGYASNDLTIDERIESIDKRLEELNNQEESNN